VALCFLLVLVVVLVFFLKKRKQSNKTGLALPPTVTTRELDRDDGQYVAFSEIQEQHQYINYSDLSSKEIRDKPPDKSDSSTPEN